MRNETIHVGQQEIRPGKEVHFELPVARLVTGTWLSLPVAVLNGREAGPRVWLSATVHGDELNGMEIIRRVLREIDARKLHGTLIAVPVLNVFGFIGQSRYLPDRRDLNRSFPGSPKGSLAARLAHLFVTEIAQKCEYGLDFHTGSLHRENLPQIRADLEDSEARRLSEAFGAPLMFQAPAISGTLRNTVKRLGVHYLLYEGGEPLRFNEGAITSGVLGALRVLNALGMWTFDATDTPVSFEASSTRWLRASRSGILHLGVGLGDMVSRGQSLGQVAVDFFTKKSLSVKAPFDGMVIGYTNNPLVNQGDALIHLAKA